MERFLLGQCRSGKVVSSRPDLDEIQAPEELFDAMAMLLTMALREYRCGNFELAAALQSAADNAETTLSAAGQLKPQLDAIGARTSLDIARHARRMLRPEFRD